MNDASQAPLPRHVCIVMDGNGRWAKKRMMPRTYGHSRGVEATRRTIEFCARSGIPELTLFAFSSENWNRPQEEVNSLLRLFVQSLQQNTAELIDNDIRIRFIGERESFSAELRDQIRDSEQATEHNRRMLLNVAANYGGRWDILQAARRLALDARAGRLEPENIGEAEFGAGLATGDSPDPDLFIRTGGEHRISNFLLWQMAYAELYFCDTLWPDFDEIEMQRALDAYAGRQRRFGKTAEQHSGVS